MINPVTSTSVATNGAELVAGSTLDQTGSKNGSIAPDKTPPTDNADQRRAHRQREHVGMRDRRDRGPNRSFAPQARSARNRPSPSSSPSDRPLMISRPATFHHSRKRYFAERHRPDDERGRLRTRNCRRC